MNNGVKGYLVAEPVVRSIAQLRPPVGLQQTKATAIMRLVRRPGPQAARAPACTGTTSDCRGMDGVAGLVNRRFQWVKQHYFLSRAALAPSCTTARRQKWPDGMGHDGLLDHPPKGQNAIDRGGSGP
jgi:hypothetical protein